MIKLNSVKLILNPEEKIYRLEIHILENKNIINFAYGLYNTVLHKQCYINGFYKTPDYIIQSISI